MNRFGPYVLSDFNKVTPKLQEWQPAIVVLHDGEAKKENVDQIRELSPDTKIIGRLYKSDSWYDENIRRDPEGTARIIIEDLNATDWAHEVDYVLCPNEICQDWSGLPFLNRYHVAFQNNCDIPQVLASFSVENPGWSPSDPDGWHASLMKHWELFYQAMEGGIIHGDILGLHQYNANRVTLGAYEGMRRRMSKNDFRAIIRKSGGSIFTMLPEDVKTDLRRIFRFEALVWPYLPEGLQQLPYAHTEFAWDLNLWPYYTRTGWLDPLAAISTEDANGQLSWYANIWDTCFAEQPLLGCALYGSGDSGSWEWFDITSTLMSNGERREEPLIDVIARHNTGGDWPLTDVPPTPDPNPPSLEDALKEEADNRQTVFMNPDAALQKAASDDGYCLVETEFTLVFNDVEYVAVKAENPDIQQARIYYAVAGIYNQIFTTEY